MQQIDIGGVLSRVFKTYQENFVVLAAGALIVFLPIAILNALIRTSVTSFLVSILVSILQFVGTYLYAGMVVQLVRDIQDGRRDSSLGQLFSSVVPVLGALIIVGVLASIGIGIGFLLLIVPGLFLLTIWAVVSPVVVLEHPGVLAAFERSRELVRGNGWPVFGVLVILFVIQFVVLLLLTAIIVGIVPNLVGITIAQLIAYVLVAPLAAVAAATLYFQLLATREGAPAAPGTVGAAPTQPVTGDQPATAPAQPAAPSQAPPSQPPPGSSPPGSPPAGSPPPGSPPAGSPPPGSPPPGSPPAGSPPPS